MAKSLFKKDETYNKKGAELADKIDQAVTEILDDFIINQNFSTNDVRCIATDTVACITFMKKFLRPR